MKRLFIILGIAIALLLLLAMAFPYANLDGRDRSSIFINLTLILLFGSSLAVHFRGNLKGALGKAFIWIVIFLGLIVGYSFKPALIDIKERLTAQLFPQYAIVDESGEVSIRKSENGHFQVKAMVNGKPVLFMVDTGASSIVLSAQDAERIGFKHDALHFNQFYNTANGQVRGASIRLNSIQIGSIHLQDMPASVNGGQMNQSLLGMRFLEQLSSYTVEGDTLILRP